MDENEHSENLFDFSQPLQYGGVTETEVIFDKNNQPLSKEDVAITPMQVIKGMARNLGQTINDPKPSCKHCHGRGYIGRDSESKAPIPCSCFYPSENKGYYSYMLQRAKHMNRAERRNWERNLKKQIKKDPTLLVPEGENFDSI